MCKINYMCGRLSEERKMRFQLASGLPSGNGWPTSGHANSSPLTVYFHVISGEYKPGASDEVLPAWAGVSDSLAACLPAAILGAGFGAAEAWHAPRRGALSRGQVPGRIPLHSFILFHLASPSCVLPPLSLHTMP